MTAFVMPYEGEHGCEAFVRDLLLSHSWQLPSDKLVSLAGSQGGSATPSLVTRRGKALLQRLRKVQLPKRRPMGEGAASSSPCKMCSTGTVTLFDFIAHQAILHTHLSNSHTRCRWRGQSEQRHQMTVRPSTADSRATCPSPRASSTRWPSWPWSKTWSSLRTR